MTARSERRAARAAWASVLIAVLAALLAIWRESQQWGLTALLFIVLAGLCSLGTWS